MLCYEIQFHSRLAGLAEWEGVRNESTRDAQLLSEMLISDFLPPSPLLPGSVLDTSGQKQESLGNAVPCDLGKSRRVRMDLKPSRPVSGPHNLLTTALCPETCRQKRKRPEDRDTGCCWQLAKGYHSPQKENFMAMMFRPGS